MAAPIAFPRKQTPPSSPPHEDALESALELIQELHDKGVLSLLRGLVGAGDHIVTQLSEGAANPDAIRAVRNLTSVFKILGRVNPEILDRLLTQLPQKPELGASLEPVSLWTIVKSVAHHDTRRGLAGALAFASAFGKALATRPQLKD